MKVRSLLGAEEAVEQEQPTPELVLSRNGIGLEYEWENTSKYPTLEQGQTVGSKVPLSSPKYPLIAEVHKYFNVHGDGSLRNNGKEFTFKGPYRGSKIVRALVAMDDCSRALEFTGSYRTSLHVHLDMGDLNFPEDLVLFGAVYCVVELFLYNFVGQNRFTCNYCVPWYKHPYHFEQFIKTTRAYKDAAVIPAFKHNKAYKYSGLNCFSLGDFGTVEFRHAPVNMQLPKIITWINIIMRIKQWTQNNHHLSIPRFIDSVIHRSPESMLSEIFQTQYNDVVRGSRNLEADYWNGIETLYQYAAI